MNIFEISQLKGGYGKELIIQGIDLEVVKGEWLTILGANGSGKSTLLKLIGRILSPTAGIILLDGKNIHNQPARHTAQTLALLPQSPAIPEGLTVFQLVSLGRNPYQFWWEWELDTEGKKQVSYALCQTNLLALQNTPIEQLSGGQRQRAFFSSGFGSKYSGSIVR